MGAAAAAAATGAAAAGMATSVMLRRVCGESAGEWVDDGDAHLEQGDEVGGLQQGEAGDVVDEAANGGVDGGSCGRGLGCGCGGQTSRRRSAGGE